MRKISLSLFAILFCLSCAAFAWGAPQNSLPKSLSYEEALKTAKEKNKNIMIFFWAGWCDYCKMAKEELLPDPRVKKFLEEKMLFVSQDVENDKSKLSRKYRVSGLPTFVFLDPQGEAIFPLPGFMEPDLFLAVLDYVESKAYEKGDFDSFYEEKYIKASPQGKDEGTKEQEQKGK